MEKNIPIYMVTNTDMVAYTATTMASVLYTTKSNIDFYVVDCGLSDWDKKTLLTLKDKFSNLNFIKFYPVDPKQFDGLQTWYFGTLDAWAALLMPNMLPDNVEKILHIESDTILLDDVAKLYNEDLEDYTIGATIDIAKTFDNNPELQFDRKYFNLGYMLVNCKKWKEEEITKKALELGKQYGKAFMCLHQDALNMIFQGKFKSLPNKYNLADRKIRSDFDYLNKNYMDEEWKHPVLVHFSPNKPWRTQLNFEFYTRNTKYFNEWWFFASMTPYIEGLRQSFVAKRMDDIFNNNSGSNLDTLNNDNILKGYSNIFMKNNKSEKKNYVLSYRLFSLIPLLKIKEKNTKKKIYLFGIPVLTTKTSKNKPIKTYRLFNLISILKLKIKNK